MAAQDSSSVGAARGRRLLSALGENASSEGEDVGVEDDEEDSATEEEPYLYAELEMANAWMDRCGIRNKLCDLVNDPPRNRRSFAAPADITEFRRCVGATPEDLVLHGDFVCIRARGKRRLVLFLEKLVDLCLLERISLRASTARHGLTEDTCEHFFLGKSAAALREERRAMRKMWRRMEKHLRGKKQREQTGGEPGTERQRNKNNGVKISSSASASMKNKTKASGRAASSTLATSDSVSDSTSNKTDEDEEGGEELSEAEAQAFANYMETHGTPGMGSSGRGIEYTRADMDDVEDLIAVNIPWSRTKYYREKVDGPCLKNGKRGGSKNKNAWEGEPEPGEPTYEYERRYVRISSGLDQHTPQTLRMQITMDTLLWYSEWDRLVLLANLYSDLALVDIDAEPVPFQPDGCFCTRSVAATPSSTTQELIETDYTEVRVGRSEWRFHRHLRGMNLKHPPGWRIVVPRKRQHNEEDNNEDEDEDEHGHATSRARDEIHTYQDTFEALTRGVFDRKKMAIQLYPHKAFPHLAELTYGMLADTKSFAPGSLSVVVDDKACFPRQDERLAAGEREWDTHDASPQAVPKVAEPRRGADARAQCRSLTRHAETEEQQIPDKGSSPSPTRRVDGQEQSSASGSGSALAVVPSWMAPAVKPGSAAPAVALISTRTGGCGSGARRGEGRDAGKPSSSTKSVQENANKNNSSARQEQRVITFVQLCRDAMQLGSVSLVRQYARFAESTLVPLTHGRPRKRLHDAMKLSQKWLVDKDDVEKEAEKIHRAEKEAAQDEREHEEWNARIRREQARLVLDFVGLLDKPQSAMRAGGVDAVGTGATTAWSTAKRNKMNQNQLPGTSGGRAQPLKTKTCKRSWVPLANVGAARPRDVTAAPHDWDPDAGARADADPESAYLVLRSYLLLLERRGGRIHEGVSFVGPVMGVHRMVETLDRVAHGDRSWSLPPPGEQPAASGAGYDPALMHLALLLNEFQSGRLFDPRCTKAHLKPPACFPEALRMFGVTLFALGYPGQVFRRIIRGGGSSRSSRGGPPQMDEEVTLPRDAITVLSGLPVNPQADHEQYALCCFRDQVHELDHNRTQTERGGTGGGGSGPCCSTPRKQQEHDSTSSDRAAAAAATRSLATLGDPFRLSDLRIASLGLDEVQKRMVSTPHRGPSERVFWLSRQALAPWAVTANREAFLYYRVVDCAYQLRFQTNAQRASVLQRPEYAGMCEQDIPDFAVQCLLPFVENADRDDHGPRLGFENDLSKAEVYAKAQALVRMGRKKEKLLQAVVGFGDANLPSAHVANGAASGRPPSLLDTRAWRRGGHSTGGGGHVEQGQLVRATPPPASLSARLMLGDEADDDQEREDVVKMNTCFTSAATQFECANQDLIAALLRRNGGKESMVLPFLPPAPQSASDFLFEKLFWESFGDFCAGALEDEEELSERREAQLDEAAGHFATAFALMCCEEGLDVEEIAHDVAPSLTRSDESASLVLEVTTRACAWLLDPAVRKEQVKRAREVEREWDNYQRERQGSGSRCDRAVHLGCGRGGPEFEREQHHRGQKDKDLEEEVLDERRERAQQLFRAVEGKLLKYRKTQKHLRSLTKLGLLNLDSELVRRNVRGSHITYHGPGGAGTIVKNHRATAPLTGKRFAEKVVELEAVSQGVEVGVASQAIAPPLPSGSGAGEGGA